MYFDGERYPEAVTWYEAALKVNPKHVNASTDLGIAYYYSNQPDRALAQFDRSLAIDPKHSKTLLNQGIVRAFAQAGPRRGGEGVAAGARRRARQPGGGARQTRARRDPLGAPHANRDTAGREATRRVGLTWPR